MFCLEANGPIIAQEMRDLAAKEWQGIGSGARFTVVTIAYDRSKSRAIPRNTLKRAFGTLASVCHSTRGKLHKRGEFAAAVVTPEGRVMTYQEVKALIRRVA